MSSAHFEQFKELKKLYEPKHGAPPVPPKPSRPSASDEEGLYSCVQSSRMKISYDDNSPGPQGQNMVGSTMPRSFQYETGQASTPYGKPFGPPGSTLPAGYRQSPQATSYTTTEQRTTTTKYTGGTMPANYRNPVEEPFTTTTQYTGGTMPATYRNPEEPFTTTTKYTGGTLPAMYRTNPSVEQPYTTTTKYTGGTLPATYRTTPTADPPISGQPARFMSGSLSSSSSEERDIPQRQMYPPPVPQRQPAGVTRVDELLSQLQSSDDVNIQVSMQPNQGLVYRRQPNMDGKEVVFDAQGRCSCCPYGYHVDVDFIRYCDTMGQDTLKQLKKIKRVKRAQRKSMEMMLQHQESGSETSDPPPDVVHSSEKYFRTLPSDFQTSKMLDELDTSLTRTVYDSDSSSHERSSTHVISPETVTVTRTYQTFPREKSESVTSLDSQVTSSSELPPTTTIPELTSAQIAETMESHLPGDGGPQSPTPAMLQAVREQMARSLQRMRELEEQVKAVPVLQVRISVLKEEKRLLMLQLKAKSNKLNTRSIGVGDTRIDDVEPARPRSRSPSGSRFEMAEFRSVRRSSGAGIVVSEKEQEFNDSLRQVHEREIQKIRFPQERIELSKAGPVAQEKKPDTRSVGVGDGNVFDAGSNVKVHEKEVRTIVIGSDKEAKTTRNVGIMVRPGQRDVGQVYNSDPERPLTKDVATNIGGGLLMPATGPGMPASRAEMAPVSGEQAGNVAGGGQGGGSSESSSYSWHQSSTFYNPQMLSAFNESLETRNEEWFNNIQNMLKRSVKSIGVMAQPKTVDFESYFDGDKDMQDMGCGDDTVDVTVRPIVKMTSVGIGAKPDVKNFGMTAQGVKMLDASSNTYTPEPRHKSTSTVPKVTMVGITNTDPKQCCNYGTNTDMKVFLAMDQLSNTGVNTDIITKRAAGVNTEHKRLKNENFDYEITFRNKQTAANLSVDERRVQTECEKCVERNLRDEAEERARREAMEEKRRSDLMKAQKERTIASSRKQEESRSESVVKRGGGSTVTSGGSSSEYSSSSVTTGMRSGGSKGGEEEEETLSEMWVEYSPVVYTTTQMTSGQTIQSGGGDSWQSGMSYKSGMDGGNSTMTQRGFSSGGESSTRKISSSQQEQQQQALTMQNFPGSTRETSVSYTSGMDGSSGGSSSMNQRGFSSGGESSTRKISSSQQEQQQQSLSMQNFPGSTRETSMSYSSSMDGSSGGNTSMTQRGFSSGGESYTRKISSSQQEQQQQAPIMQNFPGSTRETSVSYTSSMDGRSGGNTSMTQRGFSSGVESSTRKISSSQQEQQQLALTMQDFPGSTHVTSMSYTSGMDGSSGGSSSMTQRGFSSGGESSTRKISSSQQQKSLTMQDFPGSMHVTGMTYTSTDSNTGGGSSTSQRGFSNSGESSTRGTTSFQQEQQQQSISTHDFPGSTRVTKTVTILPKSSTAGAETIVERQNVTNSATQNIEPMRFEGGDGSNGSHHVSVTKTQRVTQSSGGGALNLKGDADGAAISTDVHNEGIRTVGTPTESGALGIIRGVSMDTRGQSYTTVGKTGGVVAMETTPQSLTIHDVEQDCQIIPRQNKTVESFSSGGGGGGGSFTSSVKTSSVVGGGGHISSQTMSGYSSSGSSGMESSQSGVDRDIDSKGMTISSSTTGVVGEPRHVVTKRTVTYSSTGMGDVDSQSGAEMMQKMMSRSSQGQPGGTETVITTVGGGDGESTRTVTYNTKSMASDLGFTDMKAQLQQMSAQMENLSGLTAGGDGGNMTTFSSKSGSSSGNSGGGGMSSITTITTTRSSDGGDLQSEISKMMGEQLTIHGDAKSTGSGDSNSDFEHEMEDVLESAEAEKVESTPERDEECTSTSTTTQGGNMTVTTTKVTTSQSGGLRSIMKLKKEAKRTAKKSGVKFAEKVSIGGPDSSGESSESDIDSLSDEDSYDEGSYDGRHGNIVYTCRDDEVIAQGAPGAKMFDQNVREIFEIDEELQAACEVVEKHDEEPGSVPTDQLNSAMNVIQQNWFKASSQKLSNPNQVEDFLSCFNEFSKDLMEKVVNMNDANGNTALHYAVSHCNWDVVSLLLDTGLCDVNLQNKAGYTAIMLAALADVQTEDAKDAIRLLFDSGDINATAQQAGQTALMLAVSHGRVEMVKLILEAGANVNVQDEDGSTALMCATEHGHIDIVKTLLSHPHTDTALKDNDDSTALSIALEAGHKDIGLLLYARENMGKPGSPGFGLKRKSTPTSSPSVARR